MATVVDDILSPESMDYLMNYITDKDGLNRMFDPTISGYIWDRVKTHIPSNLCAVTYLKQILGACLTPSTLISDFFHEEITLKSNINENRYSVLVYLDTTPDGGFTIKPSEDEGAIEQTIESRPNRMIIFDRTHYTKNLPITQGNEYWIRVDLISTLQSSNS